MNRELRCCPNCNATEYVHIITVSPSHFVPLNHSYCGNVLEVLGVDPHEPFPIVRCRLCGFQYSQYVLTPDLLNRLYNQCIDPETSQAKIYRVYKRRAYVQIWTTLFYLWSEGKQDETLDVRLLDYGCGWGDFMMTAQMPGLRCIGMEYDQRKIAYVKDLGFEVVDSHDDLQSAAPFDLFFCNQVLEHVSQPKMVMQKINSCLSPGAYGFVGVPDFGAENLEDAVNRFSTGGLVNKNINPWEHLNYFSPALLVTMLRDSGFRVIQPNQGNPLKSFLSATRRCLRLRKNRMSGRLSGMVGKTRQETCACIHNCTSFFVQKIGAI
jgi:2-polyprenyl-3-methyl-5-hydroxy-6-metoxy-1,4-benzoquinol methylase